MSNKKPTNLRLMQLLESSSTSTNNSIDVAQSDVSFDHYRSDDSRHNSNRKKLGNIGKVIAIDDSPLPELRVEDSLEEKDYNDNMKNSYLNESDKNKYDGSDIEPSEDSTVGSNKSSKSRTSDKSVEDSYNDTDNVVYKSPKKKLVIKSDSDDDDDDNNSNKSITKKNYKKNIKKLGSSEESEKENQEESQEGDDSIMQAKSSKEQSKKLTLKRIITPVENDTILYEDEDDEQKKSKAQNSMLNYRDKSFKKIISDEEDVEEVSDESENQDDDDDEDYVAPKELYQSKSINLNRDSIVPEKDLEIQSKFANDSDIIDISDSPVRVPAIGNSTMMNETAKRPYPIFNNMVKKDREIAGWSPNYEKVKAKVEQAKKIQEENTRKMQMIELNDKKSEEVGNALKDLKYHQTAIRGPNVQITNRNLGFEGQLKYLSDELLKVLETKPNPDLNYEDLKPPKGIKVSLLPHQRYSMMWLKWRESDYPNGGILADDMGLGKTLTILAYLKLTKDEAEEKIRRKLDKLRGEDEDDEDNYESDGDKKSKKSTKKSIEYEDDEEDEELKNSKEFIRKRIFQKKYSNKNDIVKRLRTLIILPASLLHQWQGEIENKFEKGAFKYHVYHDANRKKYSYNLDDNDIVFTTYEIATRELNIFDKEGNERPCDSPLAKIKWKRIILDEAHKIKNHTAKVSKVISSLKGKFRLAITGTPIHNSMNDLYSLVKFLHFEPLSDISLWKYLFASESKTSASERSKNAVEREKRSNSWIALLSDYVILRRTKTDKIKGTEQSIVDLPKKNYEVVRFKLNGSEKIIYDKIFKESKEKVTKILQSQQQKLLGKTNQFAGGGVSDIFVYLLRLRQACCHMSLLSECLDTDELIKMRVEAEGIDGLMQNLSLNGSGENKEENKLDAVKQIEDNIDLTKCLKRSFMSAKLEHLMDMVEKFIDDFPDDKMIIVSQWTSMLSIVGRFLQKRDIKFCEIKGDIMLFKRNEIVESFNKKENDEVRVMLLSLTAGGVGLNLIGANRMFLLDIHWNPALEQQCADRIYRVGQKKEVFVYKFLCENTIEERIEDIQKAKLELAHKVCSASATNIPGMATSSTNSKLTLKDFKLLFQDFENNDNNIN